MFPFPCFNAMQSAVFHAAYSNPAGANLVVSAPTGSGKTAIFELCFLHMLNPRNTTANRPLAVYMAPTKALCSERERDWGDRMRGLQVTCLELTGDTDTTAAYGVLGSVDLIVTTPEKWDAITRRSFRSDEVSRLRLLMIDEVHILHEERGPTLEVVVTRMKKVTHDQARIVAVSASVPNIKDVARWIGPKDGAELDFEGGVDAMPKADVFEVSERARGCGVDADPAPQFGDEYRPVPLTRKTYGYDAPSEWTLGSKLDKELFSILTRHSDGLPVLIFCPTRKMCIQSAEQLAKDYQAALSAGRRLPWDSRHKWVHRVGRSADCRSNKITLKDPKIQALTQTGIAVHHAGLDLLDRRVIEDAFKDSKLHVIVSTTVSDTCHH